MSPVGWFAVIWQQKKNVSLAVVSVPRNQGKFHVTFCIWRQKEPNFKSLSWFVVIWQQKIFLSNGISPQEPRWIYAKWHSASKDKQNEPNFNSLSCDVTDTGSQVNSAVFSVFWIIYSPIASALGHMFSFTGSIPSHFLPRSSSEQCLLLFYP